MSSPRATSRAAKVPFWGGMRYNGVTIFRKAAAALKITALVENTVPEDLAAQLGLGKEHGLSLYIEACGHKILFDMGQTGLFARNAAALGVDLAAVDLAVLSHGHYDHGGGLARFLELNSTAPVYLNEHAFEPHYHGAERYIGLDPALAASPRLHLTGEEAVLAPGLTLAACNRRPRRYDLGSFGLTVQEGGGLPARGLPARALPADRGGGQAGPHQRVLPQGDFEHRGLVPARRPGGRLPFQRPASGRDAGRLRPAAGQQRRGVLHLPLHRPAAVRVHGPADEPAALPFHWPDH